MGHPSAKSCVDTGYQSTTASGSHLEVGVKKIPGKELLGILGGGVPPVSPNPSSILDQKMSIAHPFSDLASKIQSDFQTSHINS